MATVEGDLAFALWRVERSEEAEAHYRNALRIRLAIEGPDNPNVLMTRQRLAAVLVSRGQYEEAEEQLQQALDGSLRKLGPNNRVAIACHDSLRQLHTARGDLPRALEEADAALAAADPNDGQRGVLMIGRAEVLMAMDRDDDARAQLQAAIAALDPEDPAVGVARGYLDELE